MSLLATVFPGAAAMSRMRTSSITPVKNETSPKRLPRKTQELGYTTGAAPPVAAEPIMLPST